ncbi:MAG: OadG family protein [Bacteroidales bacterium]|nr:OadG family protein [Bacteroidales bacterium]
MKRNSKQLVAIFVGILLMMGSAVAGPAGQPVPPQPTPPVADCHGPMHHHADMPINLVSVRSCYVPAMNAYVLIDSIDCAVDLLVRHHGELRRVGRFTTDVFKGRHDLKNILRPVSVSVVGDKIVVLTSSQKDSSYLAFVDMHPNHCSSEGGEDTLQAAAIVGMPHAAYAFHFNVEEGEIVVVGKNAVGYDLSFVDLGCGVGEAKLASTFHYHVPKQAERIQASDPHGLGLAIVAIAVVFFALICICFIMKGYGAAIMKVQDRKGKKAAAKGEAISPAKSKDVAGEVYAAIAAAIYAYEQDLHDEEDTVITIQKVERAWTPWNAKLYNMNQYFSTRR